MSFADTNIDIVSRLVECADLDSAEHGDAAVISMTLEAATIITTLRAELDNIKTSWALLRAENEQLRAYKAECEAMVHAGKITKWINANTAICSGEGFAAAETDSLVYLFPIPSDRVADKPRITEQDAREIAYSALCSVTYDSEVYINNWMASVAPDLLNKLNADREQVPTFDLTCNNFLSMLSGAIPVPDNITNVDEFYDWCKSLPDEQVPAVSVPDGWKLVPIVMSDDMDNSLHDSLLPLTAGADPYCESPSIDSQKLWDSLLKSAPAMLSASPALTNGLEAALPKPLPYWPPCNPGCDPVFNGERSAWCADHCKPARDAMNADQCPSHESELSAPDSGPRSRMINGYELTLTSAVCPEQYDVRKDGVQAGYLRLRSGEFTVEVPDVGGHMIIEADDFMGDGCFEDDDERTEWLTRAIEAIDRYSAPDSEGDSA